jgi:hypothetical protein
MGGIMGGIQFIGGLWRWSLQSFLQLGVLVWLVLVPDELVWLVAEVLRTADALVAWTLLTTIGARATENERIPPKPPLARASLENVTSVAAVNARLASILVWVVMVISLIPSS